LVYGKFHLGQLYDLKSLQLKAKQISQQDETTVFLVNEQSELKADKFLVRYLMITQGALLLFEPIVSRTDGITYNRLIAWASLQSI